MASWLEAVVGLFTGSTPNRTSREPTRRKNSPTRSPAPDDQALEDDDPFRPQSLKLDRPNKKKAAKQDKKKKFALNWKICALKKRRSHQDVKFLRETREPKKLKKEIAEIRHTASDTICPICLKYICQSVTVVCGHSYCDVCINEYLLVAPVKSTDPGLFRLRSQDQGKEDAGPLQTHGQSRRAVRFPHPRMLKDINDSSETLDYNMRKRERKEYWESRK